MPDPTVEKVHHILTHHPDARAYHRTARKPLNTARSLHVGSLSFMDNTHPDHPYVTIVLVSGGVCHSKNGAAFDPQPEAWVLQTIDILYADAVEAARIEAESVEAVS